MEMYSDLENNIWQENGGNSICYGIPELAKPLLKQPTEVLKLKNVVGFLRYSLPFFHSWGRFFFFWGGGGGGGLII